MSIELGQQLSQLSITKSTRVQELLSDHATSVVELMLRQVYRENTLIFSRVSSKITDSSVTLDLSLTWPDIVGTTLTDLISLVGQKSYIAQELIARAFRIFCGAISDNNKSSIRLLEDSLKLGLLLPNENQVVLTVHLVLEVI
jgi:hypothetical protein